MPHYPKPFFRAPRGLWYVQIDGRQDNLGADRDEAFRRYHDLTARDPDSPGPPAGDAEVLVLEAFLDRCQKHPVPRSYDRYRKYLQSCRPTSPSSPRRPSGREGG